MKGRELFVLMFAFWVAVAEAYAQTPLGFNYQGVARSADGSPLINQFIGLRVSITSGPSGSIDYVEEHHPETNEFGLFNVVVGQGQSSGNISDVNWGEGNKWLQIEIDPQDNSNYTLVGSQQMMSVPYSLYAAKSGEALNAGIGIDISNGQINNTMPDKNVGITGNGAATVTGTYPNFEIDVASVEDADADPTNEIQTISKTGTTVTLSNSGGTFIDAVDDADADASNEIQTLSEVLAVGADAGAMAITNLADPVNPQEAATKSYVDMNDALDLDKDDTNEIQDISTTGLAGDISLSGGSNLSLNVDDADANPNNEIQNLQFVSNTLSITNNSTATPIDLSGYLDNTDNQNLSNVLGQGADAGLNRITNLNDPATAQDAATKNYVDMAESRASSDYSFNVDITIDAAMLFSNDLIILDTAEVFDDNNVINGTNFTTPVDGTYLFYVKGGTDQSVDLALVNGASLVSVTEVSPAPPTILNALFDEIYFVKLNSGQTIQLQISGSTSGGPLNIKFYGYKI